MRIAVYPGSFDPITNGHLDIIRRAAKLYDRLIVGVLDNINKNPVFRAEERKLMIQQVTEDLPNVTCDIFSGLLVDFAKQNHASVIVKGLRTVSDFEYEFQMALLNNAAVGKKGNYVYYMCGADAQSWRSAFLDLI